MAESTEEISSDAESVAFTSQSAGVSDSVDRPATIAPGSAIGRRKQAVARVRVMPGTGQWKVNGLALEDCLPDKLHQQTAKRPLVELGLHDQFDVIALVNGGGSAGQAGALQLGLARALNEVDLEANRRSLKKAGLLTRDARIKERKKAGLKKARKAPQYSKR